MGMLKMIINTESFLNRWKKSMGWCALLGFMYIIFGPLEIFFSNTKEFPFVINDFIWWLIISFIIVTALGSMLLSLVFRKGFDYILCLLVWGGIASYIQYLMNGKMGLLDGQNAEYRNPYLNLSIWAVILVCSFLLMRYKRIWRGIVIWVPWFINAVLLVACVSLFITSGKDSYFREESKYIFTGDGMYTVSGRENIIILVLDCFSNENVLPMLEKYPDALEGMEDFTYFNNANSVYESTYASLMNMLTGVEYDTKKAYYEWADEAWNSYKAKQLFDGLKKNEYKVHIFSNDLIYGNHPEYVEQKIDNFTNDGVSNVSVNNKRIFGLLIKASVYRYVPNILKEHIAVNTEEFSDTVTIEYKEATAVINRNYEYYEGLMDNGLKKDNSSNYFVMQHIRGTHPPYWIDEKARYVDEGELVDAARGCMLTVQTYINQLRDLGVYEDATIIVMSDHGNQQTCKGVQPIFFVKRAQEKHHEMQVSSAPISYENFTDTMLDILGIDTAEGQSFFSLREDTDRERVMYIRKWDNNYPAVQRAISGGESSINVLYKYVYTGDASDLAEKDKSGPDEIIPLLEYPN